MASEIAALAQLKLPALVDLLERRSPDRVVEFLAAGGNTAAIITEAHQLGDGDVAWNDRMKDSGVQKLVECMILDMHEDMNEIQETIFARCKMNAALRLFSSGIVLLSSAGLIFSLFGESRFASIVTGVIIFVSSLVATVVAFREEVYGGSSCLQRNRNNLVDYSAKLAELTSYAKFSAATADHGGSVRAIADLETLASDLAEVRSNLSLPRRNPNFSPLAG